MSQPAARITDMHTCPKVEPGPVSHVGGPIVTGATSVIIEGQPAAKVGDTLTCVGPPDTVVQGSPTVIIEHQPAARVGDKTAHGGVITSGCSSVIMG
ncbi:MAG: type VI secretion protein [Thioploca sp.]|nr:type VI secretion protein [Thioploca sp.]